MILKLEDAKKINENITQLELDAYEQSIRAYTNNNFQLNNVRKHVRHINESGLLELSNDSIGLFVGDTVEIYESMYNDGLYVVKAINGTSIELDIDDEQLVSEKNIRLTKVKYPSDIKNGVAKLIEYDLKMASNLGVKSRTVARMSTTYYDQTAKESIAGYPSTLMDFTRPYMKMRWGT